MSRAPIIYYILLNELCSWLGGHLALYIFLTNSIIVRDNFFSVVSTALFHSRYQRFDFFPSPFIGSFLVFSSCTVAARLLPIHKSAAERPHLQSTFSECIIHHVYIYNLNSTSPPRKQKPNVRWCNNNNNVHAECRRETSMLRCRTAARRRQ